MDLDVLINQSPANSMSFAGDGEIVKDEDAYWWKPYKDETMNSAGTAGGAWDVYYQSQYPAFTGWDAHMAGTTGADTLLTKADWLEVFDWHHRKNTEITEAFSSIDMTFGMPLFVFWYHIWQIMNPIFIHKRVLLLKRTVFMPSLCMI